eukprot:363074-Chlamydomonas_euryale.AAC.13
MGTGLGIGPPTVILAKSARQGRPRSRVCDSLCVEMLGWGWGGPASRSGKRRQPTRQRHGRALISFKQKGVT